MISLPAAKDQVRSVSDVTFEDDLLLELISSAQAYIERRIGWHLGEKEERTVHLVGDGTRTLWLAQPVEAESVSVEDVDSDDYDVRGARLVMLDDVWECWTEYEVTYEAGYAVDTAPADLRHAARLLIAGWYEHREGWHAERGAIVEEHKHAVDQILGSYERVRA